MSEPDATLGLTASLAHGGTQCEGQHRLPVEKAAAARFDAQKKSLRAAEQDHADKAAARDEWRGGQPEPNPENLVFIDETGLMKLEQRQI
jgi:hypothetical protein